MIWKPIARREESADATPGNFKKTHKNERTDSTRTNTTFLHEFQEGPLFEPTQNIEKKKKHVFR